VSRQRFRSEKNTISRRFSDISTQQLYLSIAGTQAFASAAEKTRAELREAGKPTAVYGETGAIMGVVPVNTAVETLPVP
jgi:hypothetical protein